MGRWGQVLRTPVGLVAVLGVGAVVALAVLGPVLWADDAARFDFTAVSQGASREHPLGTDALGRDILLARPRRRTAVDRARAHRDRDRGGAGDHARGAVDARSETGSGGC